MFVKICGVTNQEDALLATALGADAVGFIFAPSNRQVAAPIVRDIVRQLPSEVMTVGVFRDQSRERVVEVVNTIGLRAAQLHGNESPETCRWIADRVPITIRALPAGSPDLRRIDDFGADLLLLDSPVPGSGTVFDFGVDVASGVEAESGRKDPRLLRAFLEAARSVEFEGYDGGERRPFDWEEHQ